MESTGHRLADLTTVGLGGPAPAVLRAASADEVAVILRDCDAAGGALVVGGGSNLIVADRGVDTPVVTVAMTDVRIESPAEGFTLGNRAADAVVVLGAGSDWETVVGHLVDDGWAGLETLSGIPGSVGAAPVQNIGAYGVEIAERLVDVELYRRDAGRVERVPAEALALGYRHSALKGTDRAVVTEVRLALFRTPQPVRYPELARLLGVDLGSVVPPGDVRAAVLELRRRKGMVLDPADADTRSAGSFFTNPIVAAEQAARVRSAVARLLGGEVHVPEYPVGPVTRTPTPHDGGADNGGVPSGRVKLSAAWLIERAGFAKGYPLAERPDARISLSTKHTLALTNRGGGTTAELLELAREVRDGVRAAFGVTLEPEPVLVGCALD